MLNWYLVAPLALAIAAGFAGIDRLLVRLLGCIRKKCPHGCDRFFQTFSFTPFVVLALFGAPFLVFAVQREWYTAAALALACSFSLGLSFFGKYVFRRVRPLGHTTYLGKIDSAFPSAHTAGSFTAAFALAIFYPPLTIPVFLLAALVAFSRLYLQLHFFSDVAGGILLAYLMVRLVLDSSLLVFLGF